MTRHADPARGGDDPEAEGPGRQDGETYATTEGVDRLDGLRTRRPRRRVAGDHSFAAGALAPTPTGGVDDHPDARPDLDRREQRQGTTRKPAGPTRPAVPAAVPTAPAPGAPPPNDPRGGAGGEPGDDPPDGGRRGGAGRPR